MDFNIDTKGKGLFLTVATISLIVMMGVTTLLWYFISPRLHEINEILANLSLTALRGFYILLITGSLIINLTCFTEKDFIFSKLFIKLFIKILFPVTMFLGTLVGIKKNRLRESFVFVNNAFIKAMRKKKFKPKEVLILLPHCLQNVDCKIRISTNIHNCIKCGKCDIAELCEIADKHEVPIAIATGGTLARRIVLKYRPKFIIAVACQRDLVSGLQDVFPIPVFGVLNLRPEGPCYNTRVEADQIDQALEKILIK